jgi:uncharacterized protein YhbP (UPF0306 family)
MPTRDLPAIARGIIDSNVYMTLGTADEQGRPWVSPVYYAVGAYTHYYWVSSPEATHSRNVAARPQVSIVIFDSRTPIGKAQAVYISGVAQELTGAELENGIEVFSRRSMTDVARQWTVDDVQPPALHRLYRATATEYSMLDPVRHGVDSRTPISVFD